MPVYTYRREDGTTFDIRQSFADDPLNVCPTTGQHVVRVVQNAGVIFKGSGFYVNDSKNAAKPAAKSSKEKDSGGSSEASSGDSKPASSESTPAPKASEPATT